VTPWHYCPILVSLLDRVRFRIRMFILVCSVRLLDFSSQCHLRPSGAWIYPVHESICHSDIVSNLPSPFEFLSSTPPLGPSNQAHSNYGTSFSCLSLFGTSSRGNCRFLSIICHPHCPRASSCADDARCLDTPYLPSLSGALCGDSVRQLLENSQLAHSSYCPQSASITSKPTSTLMIRIKVVQV